MADTSNKGGQVAVFNFKQEARAIGFNQAFCDILPYGIYTGGELSKVSNTTIDVAPLTCIIKSYNNDKVALRQETTSNYRVDDVSPSKPYIVIRYGWLEQEFNYMTILAVGGSENPDMEVDEKLHSLDIILGKVVYDGIEIPSDNKKAFDLTLRQDVFFNKSAKLFNQFKVSATDPISNKVNISGGVLNTSKGHFTKSGTEFDTGASDTNGIGSGNERIDLIVLDVNGDFKFIKGVPAVSPLAPNYGNYKVLAEIRRGHDREDINGSDIKQVSDATIRGPISLDDYILDDSEGLIPSDIKKSVESVIRFILHNNLGIHPDDPANDGKVLRKHIKWGLNEEEDDVNASAMPIINEDGLFASSTVEGALAEIAGAGRTTETLKGLNDDIHDLSDYLDSQIYCSYNQSVYCSDTSTPIFFAKVKKHTSTVFNLKVDGPANMQGTISLVVTVGESADLTNSSISILSQAIPFFYAKSIIYLATNVDNAGTNDIFVGFTTPITGQFDISFQSVSSEPGAVAEFIDIKDVSLLNKKSFLVSEGYLAGYPVIKNTNDLLAFKEWSPDYQYKENDPVFWKGQLYIANELSVPIKGESPPSPSWNMLAKQDISIDVDFTEGVKTPQLFYQPGLIISNSDAVGIRKAYQDQGMEYPSKSSLVYHLDGDYYDQHHKNESDQLVLFYNNEFYRYSPISESLEILPEFSFDGLDEDLFEWEAPSDPVNIMPHFINEESEELISTDLKINKKPFKEIAQALYGTMCIPVIIPNNTGQNTIDFWFKIFNMTGCNVFTISLLTHETIDLTVGYEEPFWNENDGVVNAFNYNKDVGVSGLLPYNERIVSSEMNLLQVSNDQSTITPVDLSINLDGSWNHIAIEIGNTNLKIFLNGNEQEFTRLTSNFGGNSVINLNPHQRPFIIDELMVDWTKAITFERFKDVSSIKLPWAAHEWGDGWLTIFANDPEKIDSNLALYLYPVGSVITQASVGGVYDPTQTPWARFHNFTEDQFALQGEVTPVGGNGQKTRFYQRIH